MKPWIERAYARSPSVVQNAMVSAYGLKIRLERFNRRHDQWVRFLEESEKYSAAELEAYQDERLRRLVAHAYEKVPYYRKVMRERGLAPGDVRRRSDLVKLPVLTKDLVRRHTRELVAEGVRLESLKPSPTSGTTGTPFTVWWDRETDVLWNVMIWRHRRWAGVTFGERYATLLGRMVVPPDRRRPPFWRRNWAWNQILLSSFHLDPENVPLYAAALRRSGAVALEAYPSTAYILALGLERVGERVPLRAVFTSSEPLLDFQRETVEDRFACEVFDYYGMSEAIMFAGECEAHAGLHHHAESSLVEVLDAGGEPAPAGAAGRLVGTTLHNVAMPLLRYEVGDLTTRLPGACRCGRAHPLYSPITTKAEDILVTPDGRLISPSVMTHPLKPLKGLARSQIIQEDPALVRVRLVFSGPPSDDLLAAVKEGFALRLGRDVEIRIEVVDDIPPGPSGKYRWVISKVPIQHKLARGGNLFAAPLEDAPAPPVA